MYGATVGKLGILGTDAATNQAVCAIFVGDSICRDYLFHYLKMSREDLINQSFGGAQPNISQTVIQDIPIPLPPLDEQRRIAAILDEQMAAVEQARAAAEAQLEVAQELMSAYLREVFEGEEAQEWEHRPLIELLQGKGQYGSSIKSSPNPVGVPFLGMRNIHDGRIVWENFSYIDLPDDEYEKYKLLYGDVLFNRTNSAELVGKTAVFEGTRNAVFASYLVRFQAREDILNPFFLSAYINSVYGRRFIEMNMTRAIGQVNISASTMHTMPIPVPPIHQQNAIMETLAERSLILSHVHTTLQNQLGLINQLPAALLRRAFSGEL
jgi:type I restriction enzyme S subunit